MNPRPWWASAPVSVADDVTVGVGMPIRVTFDAPVKNKKAVEEQLRVKTSTLSSAPGLGESDEVVCSGPKVLARQHRDRGRDAAQGVKTGPGAYGGPTTMISYQTGDSMVSVYDANKHTLVVKKNGKVVRSSRRPAVSPASTHGRASRSSPKLDFVVMDAATGGTSEDDPSTTASTSTGRCASRTPVSSCTPRRGRSGRGVTPTSAPDASG